MKTIFQYLALPFISIRVRWYFFCEEWKVRSRFYHNLPFRHRDRALKKAYRFLNPYRMNKVFLQKLGHRDVDTYGETPLTTLYQIVQECGITSQDHLFELGCGRGRGVLFLSDFIGCRITGIEWNPEFAARAQEALQPAQVICADILDADLSQATAIYLFGTCLPDPVIEKLVQRFCQLPSSTKIMTVSFALSDYSSAFKSTKEFTGSFPWGKTSIFLNHRLEQPLTFG